MDKYEIQIKSLMETCSNFEAENKKLNQKVSVEEEFDKDVESIARWCENLSFLNQRRFFFLFFFWIYIKIKLIFLAKISSA